MSHDGGSDVFVESEGGDLYRFEIRNSKKFLDKHWFDSRGGRIVIPTKNVFDVDALATSERFAVPRLTIIEGFLRNLCPGEKTIEFVRKKCKNR